MKARILVFDDDEDILEVFRWLLDAEGYEVHAHPAILQDPVDVEQLEPDLVILDLVMGDYKEGLLMLERMKQYPPTASIPVILCTAMLNGIPEGYAFLQNVLLVEKPFDVEEFLELVRTQLSSPA
jgi:CheY-like chemotaxis protein